MIQFYEFVNLGKGTIHVKLKIVTRSPTCLEEGQTLKESSKFDQVYQEEEM